MCAENTVCCETSETTYRNMLTTHDSTRSKIIARYEDWASIEDEIWKYAEDCPDLISSCDILGSCWDGSVRKNDENCSCPDFVYPACTDAQCPNGSQPDEKDCSCPIITMKSTAPTPVVEVPEEFNCDTFEAGVY